MNFDLECFIINLLSQSKHTSFIIYNSRTEVDSDSTHYDSNSFLIVKIDSWTNCFFWKSKQIIAQKRTISARIIQLQNKLR